MSKRVAKPPEVAKEERWPGMEVAIEGAGLSPSDVSARHLATLLEAAANLFETVAEERGVKVTPARLVALRTASAAYALRSPDLEMAAIAEEIDAAARTRGKSASPRVRGALDRLHKAGKGLGAVRLIRFDGHGRAGEPLLLAPPLEIQHATFDEAHEIFGTVVGIDAARRTGASVRLRVDDGATLDLSADLALAERCARLFMRPVRAGVTYAVTADESCDGQLEDVESWARDQDAIENPLVALDQLRADLAERGVKIIASEWIDDILAGDKE